jgi:hypothetical protein
MISQPAGVALGELRRFSMKPGDLVRITDWDTKLNRGWNPIGLVLSEPEVKNHGTTCVLVDWLESPDTEYYSVHHLEIISKTK